MKNKLFVLFVALFALFLGWRTYIYLRYSESLVYNRVLKATPLGTSFDEVERLIREKEWRLVFSSRTHGFSDQRVRPPKTVGSMYLRTSVAQYYDPFLTDLTVYWGFDESGNLIDVWVWKTVDAL